MKKASTTSAIVGAAFLMATSAVGPGFLVGLRRNGAYDTGGFAETREEAVEIARLLVATGWIDFLNVSGYPFYQGMGAARGAIVPEAAALKQAIAGKIPVFAVGDRITDPRMANEFLADGRVDMIGMVRAGIADPEIEERRARDLREIDQAQAEGDDRDGQQQVERRSLVSHVRKPNRAS